MTSRNHNTHGRNATGRKDKCEGEELLRQLPLILRAIRWDMDGIRKG